MKLAIGLILFWILGTLTIALAFSALRGLLSSDSGSHVLDGTDVAAFAVGLFGIPCFYVWRFLIAPR